MQPPPERRWTDTPRGRSLGLAPMATCQRTGALWPPRHSDCCTNAVVALMQNGAVGPAYPTHILPTHIGTVYPCCAGPHHGHQHVARRVASLHNLCHCPLTPAKFVDRATCVRICIASCTFAVIVPYPRLLLWTVPNAGGAGLACCWPASWSRCGERGRKGADGTGMAGGQIQRRGWEGRGEERRGRQVAKLKRAWQQSATEHRCCVHVT